MWGQETGAALKSLPMGNKEGAEVNVEPPPGLETLAKALACLGTAKCFFMCYLHEKLGITPSILVISSDILLREMPAGLTNARQWLEALQGWSYGPAVLLQMLCC